MYTPADDATYLLMTPFWMPADTGERWAISFSSNGGTLVAAAASLAITVSFLCLWDLICVAAVVSGGGKEVTRRRFTALATIWNSNDPWFAFRHMIIYILRRPGDLSNAESGNSTSPDSAKPNSGSSGNPNSRDTLFGLAVAVVAFAVFGASIALGIIGPSLLEIGTVAPVRPSMLFYPAPGNTPLESIQRFGLQAPGAMRALGSVEAADVTVGERVKFDQIQPRDPSIDSDEQTIVEFTYRYSVTGVDFGLQHAPHLTLVVEGSCITEYGWFVEQTEKGEEYHLWNDPQYNITIPLGDSDIRLDPRVSFRVREEIEEDDHRVQFAVVVASAHRASITRGTDPWYMTEKRPADAPTLRIEADYWMRLRRPVLSCRQKDTWSHGGGQVYSSGFIGDLPSLALKESLLSVLQAALTTPMIVTLGNAGGDSTLLSRTTSPDGVIDAGQSSIMNDMKRLIIGSFVASRSIFTDATKFGRPGFLYPDLLHPNGQLHVAEGAADFVISDPDIQTFSLTGIVTLAAVLGTLLVTVSTISLVTRPHNSEALKSEPKEDPRVTSWSRWTRLKVLSASRLSHSV